MASVEFFNVLDTLLQTNRVVVFTKSGCPYCLGAKNAVRKHYGHGITKNDVSFLDIETDLDTVSAQTYLRMHTGSMTVPKVFIKGQYVGGIDTITSLHQSGELAKMLNT